MDASTILSRLQFAFTISYHYLFPQLTMGLALLLVILKTLYLLRKDERYNTRARFATSAGDIIGQTLAMEGAFAFFLESAFLGIFLFGEQVFGQKMHLFSACMLWIGTWLSGSFIVATNAWMQHPVGYIIAPNGRFHISNFWAVLFNPWILPQYMHTMSGAVLTGSFFMTGLGAYYLLAKNHLDYGRIFVTLGV